MNFFSATILFIAASVAFGQDGKCPGGANPGDEVVSGAYYYKCEGGSLKPAGCMDDNGGKVPIGGTFVHQNVQKTCVDNGDSMTVKATACVTDSGSVVMPGQETTGDSVYLSCQESAGAYNLIIQGCMIDGQKVPIDQKVTSGEMVKQCQKTSAKTAVVVPGGCVHNGQSYDIGSQFQDETAFYFCRKQGETTKKEPIGCINDGKKIYDLDIYQKGDSFYRCRVSDSGVSEDLWGCALVLPNGSIEPKSVACTWDTGSDPINYVNCCIKQGGNAVITQLYCLYTFMGGRIQVNEGCYRIFDNVAAGCQRQSDGSLKMETWDASDVSGAVSSGLHQC